MPVFENYLTPNLSHIRQSIRGIDDSYNNTWDILAELIQNAVDAIRQVPNRPGEIRLKIDCMAKSITIYDNGIGINSEMLPDLLKPFSTNKKGDCNSIGEKGVGLKFVIFSSNRFTLKTAQGGITTTAEINGAHNWKESNSDTPLSLSTNTSEEPFTGTEVEIQEIHSESDGLIFTLTFEQMKYLLRTKTALGSTKATFGEEQAVSVSLEYTNNSAETKSAFLPFSYCAPIDLISPQKIRSSVINLDDFRRWLTEDDRGDTEKRQKLHAKIIYKKGEKRHTDQRTIKYFACYVPGRSTWNDLAVHNMLATEEQIKDIEGWQGKYAFCLPTAGITLSVKGMPTGIVIEHPATGSAGYWSNIFIIFEDPQAKFDIGRKSIHGRTANIYKSYAKEIFNDFLKSISKYASGDIEQEELANWNRRDIFNEIETIVNLDSNKTLFKKFPTNQEASVAGIFYECIGRNIIKDIIPLTSGYRNRYDLYATWKNRDLVIEFKSKLRNIIRDFSDAKKMFDDMDCIVCWDVTDDDIHELHKKGVSLKEIEESELARQTSERIPHATHIMQLGGLVRPIYVIDLRKIVLS